LQMSKLRKVGSDAKGRILWACHRSCIS
jgi:hypothetical protein